ncbi:hypothetical protein I7I53_03088 [Histoplasma capsulatum var. duboisii H88]|uniref:Uncharacterized protein n=1 Tax=Ajellomyces capsulatus (strain H88) TaxID=544711 RepID=A0A8A1LTF7_AJEC8|nr:hypothetical protein I7I53_03088 [Histoplasma capsulatum var. duboisii H88]
MDENMTKKSNSIPAAMVALWRFHVPSTLGFTAVTHSSMLMREKFSSRKTIEHWKIPLRFSDSDTTRSTSSLLATLPLTSTTLQPMLSISLM